jgi:spore coat protein H
MFFRRNGRNPDGNVYKLLWYGRGLIGQHEKKNNLQTGHQDLIEVIEGLRRVSNGEQWDFIQQHFNVDETASYYAVNMCIQNWDGFFNNYFAYHDPQPGGKWEIIPWDEDKTWGDHDGASLPYDWYSMPLTIGMKGDKPVGGSWFGGGPFGGSQWWRPPGYLSGPLLANPQFRAQFEDRLQELCNTVFTPETMGPVIQAMADRLEEEVRVRASLAGADPDEAVEEFHNNIKSIQDQVVHRRKWILDQLHASAKQRP